MSPGKPIVNDVGHKERYRWEVMHAAFEGPVCGSKYERADSILEAVSDIAAFACSQRISDIVCIH
jgi:hypothetical protein